MKVKRENGKFPAYAWPGGYPVYYLTSDNSVLCPSCANKEDAKTLDGDVNYEDDSLYCDECGKQIESSAYGDPGNNPKRSRFTNTLIHLNQASAMTSEHLLSMAKELRNQLRNSAVLTRNDQADIRKALKIIDKEMQIRGGSAPSMVHNPGKVRGFVELREHDGKIKQVFSPPYKSKYEVNRWLQDAVTIARRTGAKILLKRVIKEDAKEINPPITKEQITETQRKRYAKRRKYTGATALEKKNPPKTLIYGKTLEIKAQKTQPHHCDAACKRSGHRYVHTFKSNSQIYGLSNGDILITNHKR